MNGCRASMQSSYRRARNGPPLGRREPPPRYENDVMRVRQMSLEPSLPMYSLTDQKVVPSAGSTTVLL